MRITTAELRTAIGRILDHFESRGITEFRIDHDFYWDVPKDARYDSYGEPTELTVGQLSDDIRHVFAIVSRQEDPIGYSLVWLASVLRVIGEDATG